MNFTYKIKSFDDLKYNLERCDRLLLEHQVLLMHNKIEDAQLLFEQLYAYRTSHLKMLENRLLPAFNKALDEDFPEGAKPLYFIREKSLILKELDRFIRELADLVLHNKQADIVRIFEDYAAFKDLADHHDAREKVFLFTDLEQRLNNVEKLSLFTKIEEDLLP